MRWPVRSIGEEVNWGSDTKPYLVLECVAVQCRCILDEAHLIRNSHTNAAKAAAQIDATRRRVPVLV